MAAALLFVQFSLIIAGLSVKPAPRQFPPLEKMRSPILNGACL
jgi:hypothetical protein